jgi:hypothetical protein
LSPTAADSRMHQELEAQLEMWTNLEFPTDNGPFFQPERDNASRSRHKAIDPDAAAASSSSDTLANSLSFFGNVGAALSSQDKGKSLSQLHSINDLFQWGVVYNNADGLFNPSEIAVDPLSGTLPQTTSDPVNYATGLASEHHPLTVRDAKESRTKSLTLHTIDPATTSLAPAAKRQRVRKPASSVDFGFISHDLENVHEDQRRGHSRPQSVSITPSTNQWMRRGSLILKENHDHSRLPRINFDVIPSLLLVSI